MSTSLVSGEGVRLDLATAGVASRLLAAGLDLLVQAAALLVLVLLTTVASVGSDPAAVAAVFVTEIVLVLAGYPIVMEWLSRGRTIGKMVFGLRVVRDDGGPITFRHALVRGLAGLVIEKPGLLGTFGAAAGAITLSLSPADKRIGDMMAGTVVLDERGAPVPNAEPPPWVPVPLQPWVLALDLARLDDTLALRLRQFVARAHVMTPVAQHDLGERLRALVLERVSPAPPPGVPTPALLMAVLAERRRRAAVGASGPWRPPPPAFPPPPPPPPNPPRATGGEHSPFVTPG